MSSELTPILRWAQNGANISLTCDLTDVKEPIVSIADSSLSFQGFGVGAHGERLYSFNITPFKDLNSKKCSFKVSDRSVSFALVKKEPKEEWPRLLKSEIKPGWLRVDFDKLDIGDSEPEEAADLGMKETIDKVLFESRMKSEIDKAKDDLKVYTKVAYLTIYNILQALCFGIIVSRLLLNLALRGGEALYDAYELNSDLMLTCQVAAVLEIVNPLLGIVKTGVLAPVMQVCGRNFVLFVLILPVLEIQSDPVIFFLFLFWSFIEIFRYPLYVLTLHGYNTRFLVWLRYSLWIPLYPAGMISELLIVYKSISLAEEAARWLYPLPNVLNIEFSLSSFLKFYVVLFSFGSLHMLSHMYSARQKKLGGIKSIKSKQI